MADKKNGWLTLQLESHGWKGFVIRVIETAVIYSIFYWLPEIASLFDWNPLKPSVQNNLMISANIYLVIMLFLIALDMAELIKSRELKE